MASRIKQVFIALLQQCSTIKEDDKLKSDSFKYYNVWDNQIDDMISGKSYSFNLPAVFVEIIFGEGVTLGHGFTSYPDTLINFHIAHELLNDGDFMERNLDVFDYRDKIKKKFNLNKSVCFLSRLLHVGDKLDYKHGNVYKYIISFKTNFIDSPTGDSDSNSGDLKGVIKTLNISVFPYWQSGGNYTANVSVVSRQNAFWLCITDNTDETFTDVNWVKCSGWFKKKFLVDDYTTFEQHVYKCTVDNEDSVFNPSNWTLIV